jgi:hypothetical protein
VHGEMKSRLKAMILEITSRGNEQESTPTLKEMKTLVNSPTLSKNLKDIIPRVSPDIVERQIRMSEVVFDQKRC